MSSPQILYAEHEGVHFFKLSGDLRQVESGDFATALALNDQIQRLFREEAVKGVMVDLCQAEAMDSTHLGLVAHIGAATLEKTGGKALALSTDPHITRLLTEMALDTVLELVVHAPEAQAELQPLEADSGAHGDHAALVLRAHEQLSRLSEENDHRFRTLVSLLRDQQPKDAET